MWINSMWIKGHYLKFIQYIFLSRTILLKNTPKLNNISHFVIENKKTKKIPERFQRLLFAQAEVFGLA